MDRRHFLITAAGTLPFLLVRCNGVEAGAAPGVPREEAAAGSRPADLPDWFERARVQAHTRLTLRRHGESPVFREAALRFREMGATVFTRHVKSGGEGAWWPSSVGAVHPVAARRNVVREIIEDAHRQGSRVIAYYRHMEDDRVEAEHPDWITRDVGGQPLSTPRGSIICLNSPYRDLVEARLVELGEMGADGLYFDVSHMPQFGCWCEFCRTRFREETGHSHPARQNRVDPVWHELLAFNNRTVERAFRSWMDAVRVVSPGTVFVVSANTWPQMTSTHLSHRLFSFVDSVKTEFDMPARERPRPVFPPGPTERIRERDLTLALGYALTRDTADGRPPHVWTHGLLSADSALRATAGLLAHGCVANLDVAEDDIPDPMLRPAFELGERVSPYLASTRPVRWVGLHYSEHARDAVVPDLDSVWPRVFEPLYGGYRALLRAGLPAGIVTDAQLAAGRLEGYQALLLPAPEHLTAEMDAEVARFEAAGGHVVRGEPDMDWADAAWFLDRLHRSAPPPPVRVRGDGARVHATGFVDHRGERTVVAITNDFSWIHTGRPREPTQRLVARESESQPPRVGPFEVTLREERIPRRAFDAVSGDELRSRRSGSDLIIEVPEVDVMALAVVQFGGDTV